MRTPLPTAFPTVSLSAALACATLLTGCNSIHSFYKRDTGTIEPVPAPSSTDWTADYPDQDGGAEALAQEVTFVDPDAAPEVLDGEGPDAIQPLAETEVLPEPEVVETYVVVKGDTLGHISQKLFGTVGRTKDLINANPGINPNRMQIGDVINVPR